VGSPAVSRSVEQRRPRLGVSSCLLGTQVRYDGGHKRDRFLTDVLAPHVEWIPVCPELEAGMGVPRESVRLVGDPAAPQMVGVVSGIDHTAAMRRFSAGRVRQLVALELDGYVFKKDSPSCGVERVRVYRSSTPARSGRGLFSATFMRALPLVPVEEEGRLNDPGLRENFIERIFAHRRWRAFVASRPSRHDLVAFHTAHKYLLLAHSPRHYQELGRLVALQKRFPAESVLRRYGALLMDGLAVPATVRKHTNVLQHIAGHCHDQLAPPERRELAALIDDYRRALLPLIVPITLLRHHVARHEIGYVRDQVYLFPHPKELMLRNHV
jgi:uncharacterized protein YbgA (DUF1722 family)/uncharacterized protein YbbK (DUF523 family)